MYIILYHIIYYILYPVALRAVSATVPRDRQPFQQNHQALDVIFFSKIEDRFLPCFHTIFCPTLMLLAAIVPVFVAKKILSMVMAGNICTIMLPRS